MSVSLIDLHCERLSQWPDSRLNQWCRWVPCILLCALRVGGEPSQEGIPRSSGPYTPAELDAVAQMRVTAQCEEHAAHWRELGRWALSALYPEYTRRTGKEHACEARTWWCGVTHKETAGLVLGYQEAM